MNVYKLAAGAHSRRLVDGKGCSKHWARQGQTEQPVQLQALLQPVHLFVILRFDHYNFFIFFAFVRSIGGWCIWNTDIDAIGPAGQVELHAVSEPHAQHGLRERQPAVSRGVPLEHLKTKRQLAPAQAEARFLETWWEERVQRRYEAAAAVGR